MYIKWKFSIINFKGPNDIFRDREYKKKKDQNLKVIYNLL